MALQGCRESFCGTVLTKYTLACLLQTIVCFPRASRFLGGSMRSTGWQFQQFGRARRSRSRSLHHVQMSHMSRSRAMTCSFREDEIGPRSRRGLRRVLLKNGTNSMPLSIGKLLFVSFAPSGSISHSWPIEVGAAWFSEDKVLCWSSLIRPDPSWNERGWSEAHACLHGISQEELKSAPPAADVARHFLHLCKPATLVSTTPRNDSRWASKLAEALVPGRKILLSPADVTARHFYSGDALKCLEAHLTFTPEAGRAGQRAAHAATGFLHAREVHRDLASPIQGAPGSCPFDIQPPRREPASRKARYGIYAENRTGNLGTDRAGAIHPGQSQQECRRKRSGF